MHLSHPTRTQTDELIYNIGCYASDTFVFIKNNIY